MAAEMVVQEPGGARIGVDLGGSKIEAIVLAADGRELARRRVATPVGDYEGTLDAVAKLVLDAERDLGEQGTVGIGTPGSISSATGRLKNSNSVCLIHRPIREDLERRLGREVRLENDANCFALSETVDGAAAGARVVFGVILGTGVGGGIVVNGAVIGGANSIAGEWGHNPLPWQGTDDTPAPRCYCGREGCVETWLSGPGLSRDYALHGGLAASPGAIAAAAEAGDVVAEAALSRYEARLARSLGVVINILDPDVIVLGGGVSNLDRLYLNVPQLWGEHIFSDTVATRLVKHRHGDSSGVRGAAWLWNP